MADAKPAAAPAKRVAVVTGDGKFGTVEEHEAQLVLEGGGRVLTKQEAAEQATQERYDAMPLAQKAVGYAEKAALATPFAPIVAAGMGDEAGPTASAFGGGTREGLTAGLSDGATRQLVQHFGTKDQADAYAERVQQTRDASPIARALGTVYGMGIGSALGPTNGAGLISEAGGLAARGASRALGGLAGGGALARALATGGELAARGAVEGALMGGGEAFGEAMLGDHDVVAEKVFAQMGLGALGGAAGGALLGGTGSLLASGYRAGTGAAASGLAKVMRRGESALSGATAKANAAADEAVALVKGAADDVAKGAKGLADEASAKAAAVAEEAKGLGKGLADDVAKGAQRQAEVGAAELQRQGQTLGEMTGQGIKQIEASAHESLAKAAKLETQKGWAQQAAFDAIGSGNGLQATRYVKQAEKYLPNGTRDVGEIMLRKGIIDTEGGAMKAAMNGRAADMLPKIVAEHEANGVRIGQITNASGATVKAADLHRVFDDVISDYSKIAGRESEVAAVKSYRDALFEKMNIADPRAAARGDWAAFDGRNTEATIQSFLEQRKGLDQIIYTEQKTLDPKGRLAALRDVRAGMEDAIMSKLDEASGKVPGELRSELAQLKRDHVALSIAKELAEDSAARAAKAGTFGLRDVIMGASSGAPMMLATKLVRERGQAAAAVILSKMADNGSLTKLVQSTDEMVSRAARGVVKPVSVTPASTGPSVGQRVASAVDRVAQAGKQPEAQKEPLRKRAEAAMQRVAAIKANPEAFNAELSRRVEEMSVNAPNVAGAYQLNAIRAAAFLASKMPVAADLDPLDPHKPPRLNDSQASSFMRYVEYTQRPSLFFEEVARGKVTYEGVETAKALMPRAFAQLQTETMDFLADYQAKNRVEVIPFKTRQALGALLDIPAVPSQRPGHMKFLQGNVLAGKPDDGTMQAPSAPAATAPKRPSGLATQQSEFDRLEGG